MPDLLSAIEKVDDYTVRIRLKQANAPFLANLAMLFNVIHSAEYAEAMLRRGTPTVWIRSRSAQARLCLQGIRRCFGPLSGVP
jgi:hypothetical protein